MTKKEKAAQVVAILKEHYPATCSLTAQKDYELLFATRLSAQCTDARVNQVTPILFSRFPSLEALAGAPLEELCEIIRPCGLFRTKAQDIQSAAAMLLERFGGRVPDTMEELLQLPGIGRKTANLILSDIYGHPAIVADTHCIRISGRLGLPAPGLRQGPLCRGDGTEKGGGARRAGPVVPPLRPLWPGHLHRPEPQVRHLSPGGAVL